MCNLLEIRKERNIIVFDDATFSIGRLKATILRAMISRVGVTPGLDPSLVRYSFCYFV